MFYYDPRDEENTVRSIRISANSWHGKIQYMLARAIGTTTNMILVRDFDDNIIDLTEDTSVNTYQNPVSCEIIENKSVAKIKKDLKEKKKTILEIPEKFPRCNFKKETMEYLKTPIFDVWEWTEDEMIALIYEIYNDLGLLIDEGGVCPEALEQFILTVKASYRDNPFHNFRHAFSVTQMMYGILHLFKIKDYFTTTEKLCLITATLCHDIDHPGYSNSYLINSRSALAVRYNDISPLENHHACTCFKIMAKPKCNILANKSVQETTFIRSTIVDIILATDMVHHATYIKEWTKVANEFDPDNSQHRMTLLKLLMKCCDISNEIRPTKVSDKWLERLLDEYFAQGDLEKEMDLPTFPFMDRTKTTPSSAQIGFIKFVLIPLFKTLEPTFKEVVTENMIKPLQESLERFTEMGKKEKSKS